MQKYHGNMADSVRCMREGGVGLKVELHAVRFMKLATIAKSNEI